MRGKFPRIIIVEYAQFFPNPQRSEEIFATFFFIRYHYH